MPLSHEIRSYYAARAILRLVKPAIALVLLALLGIIFYYKGE